MALISGSNLCQNGPENFLDKKRLVKRLRDVSPRKTKKDPRESLRSLSICKHFWDLIKWGSLVFSVFFFIILSLEIGEFQWKNLHRHCERSKSLSVRLDLKQINPKICLFSYYVPLYSIVKVHLKIQPCHLHLKNQSLLAPFPVLVKRIGLLIIYLLTSFLQQKSWKQREFFFQAQATIQKETKANPKILNNRRRNLFYFLSERDYIEINRKKKKSIWLFKINFFLTFFFFLYNQTFNRRITITPLIKK